MIVRRILKRIVSFTPKSIFNSAVKFGRTHPRPLTDDESILEKFSKDNGSSCIKSEASQKNSKYNLKIIVPCFNSEKYIEACVESIVKQKTHYSILLCLINDGSTDNTLSILKRYESENVVVISQTNKGFSGARNAGLSINESDFLMFVDSDDSLLGDNVLEKCLNVAYRCKTRNDEKIIVQFKHCNKLKRGKLSKTTKSTNYVDLSGFAWGKIFSSELFDKVHFPLNYWFEDTVLPTIIYPLADSYFKNNSLIYFYRLNPDGITAKSSSSNKLLDTFYVTRQLLKDRRDLNLFEDKSFIYRFYYQTICNCVRLRLCPQNVQEQVFLETCKLFEKYHVSMMESFKSLHQSLIKKDFDLYKKFCLSYSKIYVS